MKKYISQQRNRISRAFETEVANIFRRDPHNRVCEQMKSLGNTSLERENGDKLGDIDVLVINEHHKTVSIIEAKNLLRLGALENSRGKSTSSLPVRIRPLLTTMSVSGSCETTGRLSTVKCNSWDTPVTGKSTT